jgi:hypothetical protein
MKGNTLHCSPCEESQCQQLSTSHLHLHCWPSQSGHETWSSETQNPWGQLQRLARWQHSDYGYMKPCYNVQSWVLSKTTNILMMTLGERRNNALLFVPTSVEENCVQISHWKDLKVPAVDPGLYFHCFQIICFQCRLYQIQFWTCLLQDESRDCR